MKRIILLIFSLIVLQVVSAQSIELNSGDSKESFKVSEIDSITHENRNGDLVRVAWHNNQIVSETPVAVGDAIYYVKAEPTLVGIWDAVETYYYRKYPGADWEKGTRTYTIEFNEDGTFTKSDISFVSSSWDYNSSDGSFGAKGVSIATATQTSWDRFTGTADNKDNPMKLTGNRYEGNVNTVANVEEKEGEFEMTRRQ